MLKNTAINMQAIHKIATALGELNDRAVYVGGAVVSLYANNPGAEDVRPTMDLDISLKIASLVELEDIRNQLNRRNFVQSSQDKVICRFRYEGIKVDVMSTKAVGWAPANPWFAPGFNKKETVKIENLNIQILPFPYFLASKFVAFNDRGAKDPRTSHDFEDIVYLFDNRTDIVGQIKKAPEDVKAYLMEQLFGILNNRAKQEAILGNLSYETRKDRYDRILDSIEQLR